MTTNRVEIKAITDDTVTVAGYGVVFGGEDLEGETFSKSTDYMLDLVPTKLALYDHRQNSVVKHAVGMVPNGNIKADEVGLWVEAELDRSKAYVEAIRELVEAGALGWSSGSVGHLVDRDGKNIKAWPIVEFSLTPTPAEPRTLGVEVLKSYADLSDSLRALLPEADRTSAAQSASAEDIPATVKTEQAKQEKTEMSEGQVTPTVDLSPVTDAIKQLAESQAETTKTITERLQALEDKPADNAGFAKAPAVIEKVGETEASVIKRWVKTGDEAPLRAWKASNDTDMNVGTDADGGYAVPTGHFNGIIARRDESMLAASLGVRNIPGKGTTVDVPIDNEADGEFPVVGTAEGADHDRDAPALSTKAMTLVRYTKKIQLSWELLEDEDSRLMAFLNDFVGRGIAKTENSLLITEAAASGTSLKTFASATVIAVGELEDIVGNDALGPYLDNMGSTSWIMLNSVLWEIKALASASIPYYTDLQGLGPGPNLLGYPVAYAATAGATAASAKSAYFGNWNFMGRREGGMMNFLRDPYSYEAGIELRYQFRAVYGVLQAEAIGYGEHPSA